MSYPDAPFLEDRVIDAVEEEVRFAARGLAGFGVQLANLPGLTFSGTLQFEATITGQTWVAINVFPPNSTTAVTSATAAGLWLGHCAGLSAVRVRASAWTSGTVLVSFQGAEGQGRF